MVDKHSGCPIPDGRELKSEIQKDGSKTLYYANLGTGIQVNSVEDMFCYKNSESGENNPKQNYVNLGTGIQVNSLEDMFCYKDSESGENTPKQTGGRTKVGHQFCSRCKEVGHNIFRCPLAQQAANSKTYCCWATRNTARSVSGRPEQGSRHAAVSVVK